MSQALFRRFLLPALAGFGCVLLFGLAAWPRIGHALAPDPIAAAWASARAAGSYHFDSDVIQVTIPSAKVGNIGRSSRTEALHLTGQTDLRQQSLEMQIWSDGGSVLQNASGLAVKMEGGQSYMRRQGPAGWEEWQAVESGIDGFAPQGDFLAYLAAVRDVQAHAPETRALPDRAITFTRYTFALDGPAFAAFMRDQMEQALRAKGELPPTVQLQTADYYRKMQGDGELWVREDGLPLRQILNLTFPEQQDEVVNAQITVDFSRFGRPQASLAELARAGDLPGLAAALPSVLPDPTPALILFALLAAMVLMLRYRRARAVEIAVVTAVTTSLVIGPILSIFRADAFFASQAAKAAAQDQQRADSDMQQTLRALGDRPEFNPHANPLETGDQRLEISDWAQVSSRQSPSLQSLTDDGVDTDGDGLSDFVEARVGTDPEVADTDGDGLPDALEVMGFTYGGKRWYANPLAMDSNGDGIPDETEWGRNADGSLRSTPLDTDGDGIPDLFDADNDGDGVPDRLDLSPFAKGTSTVSEADPFRLTVNNLSANQPTFVDFQLRPTSEKHLWFAFNVLDWPRNDNQGQVMDIDGVTYADIAAVAPSGRPRTAAANESYGDMKLIPMLELRIDASGGQETNLPPQSELTPYNIFVNDLTEDGSQKVVYAPLSLVTDEQTGQRVAFSGRMRYLPSGSWPSAHEVRLAWVVQALVDLACDYNDEQQRAAGCAADGYIHNVPQVIQSYYDDWTLTGLNVSEQHGAKTVIIYEDPARDDDLHDDVALFALTHALDETFLAARDQDGDGRRDVTIDDLADDLDGLVAKWEIPNILQVQSAAYPTFDQAAMYTAMTETVALLGSLFDPVWSNDPTLTPTLLYAYEQASRGLSLDALLAGSNQPNMALDLNNLYVDFQPPNQPQVEKMTVAGLKWAHYCRSESGAAWLVCAAEDYWEVLEQRYGHATLPGDPNDPDVQAGRLTITQLYDLAMSQGVHNAVQQDNTLIAARYSLKDDPAIAGAVRGALSLTSIAVVFLVNQAAWAAYMNTSVVAQLGGWARGIIQRTQGNVQAFTQFIKGGDFRPGVVILGLKVLVVAGVITAAVIAGAGGGNQDTRIALRAMALGLQIFLSLIDPLLTFARMSSAGITVAYSSEFIGVSRGSLVVGTVIAIAVVWGFFIYSMVANNVTPFSPEFNRALAETIAATIYLILLALISLTIVGLILVGIVAVIDAILTAICELGVDDLRKVPGLGGACFTLGTTAIKAIAYALYNYDVMIDTNRRDMVSPGAPETRLADPSKGFVTGNELSITMPITTNISHKNPDAANGLMINAYLYFFSPSNLRSTTFKYSLSQPDKQDLSAGLGNMRSDWQNVREHHKYAATPMYGGHATTMPAPVTGFNLQPGINQTASFYLNIGYALPAYECWMVPTPWAYTPVCYTRTFTGKNSTKMETLRYDIFPATFAEFITLATKPDGGRGLAWDSRFPSLVDADGDGLRSNAHGGVDPNDDPDTHGWDTDNDGLSDAFEMERRAAGFAFSPIQCDTDGDGLTDAQEAFFGTNPANPDTDNDGLLDSEEVWHQVYDPITCQPTGVWAGGWDVTINAAGGPLGAFTIRVTSNPLRPDSDGDGIDDLAERQLAQHTDPTKRLDDQNRPYHPGVFNSSPIKIYPETDRRYVRPGGSVIFTNTVVSNVELVPSVLDVTLPPQFGASPPPALLNFDPLTFSGSQTVTHQSILTAQPGLDTQTVPITSAVRARLMETGDPLGAATLAWDPLVPQPLGAASQVVRFSAAAAPLVDRQDHYLVSGLLSDSASRGGNGAIQTNAIPGGQSGLLDTGNSNKNALRGATTPEIACNDAGNCLVVWDQRELCSTITINYIRVVKAGSDHGTAGIEPHIYFVADGNDFDPTDGGYQRVWTPDGLNGGIDMRTGEQRGPNEKGFPITRTFCGVSRLEIYEYDTDKPFDERIGTGHQFSAADFASADPSATWRFESGGHQIDLNVTIPRKNLDTIRGALVGPTGQVLRSSFAIPAALPESQALSHNFRPVVASDGANFLVISELADETNGKTYLDYRRFDANGNLLGSPGALLIEDVRSSPSANRVTLAITWIGDRYRVARKFIHAIYDFTPIYVRDWDQSGSPLGGQWTAFADNAHGSMVGAPTLAYNPRAGQTLLLYVHVGGSGSEWRIRRLLFQGSSLTPILADDWLDFDITTFAQPQAAYNPMADGWLINWAQNIGLGNGRIIYSLWRPDLSARLVPDRTLSTPFLNLTSRAQACPVTDSQAAVDLRFEELPGATTFMDSSGRGHHATCGGAVCPAAGLPGAIDNLGIAAGAPASDYALGFNGATQQIHFSSPVDPAQDSFTIAFWYKSPPNRPGEMQILMGVGYVSLFVTSSGYAGIKVGGQQIFTTQNVNDDRWRFIVGTHNMATGQLGLYVDGAPVPVNYSTTTPGLSGYGMAVVSSANFQLDQLQVYRAPLSASAVQALYDRSLQSYCVGARYNQDQYEWLKLNVSQPDVRGGKLAASAGMTITIDGDLPTSIIGGLSHGQYIRGNTVHTIGGHASDATSGVAGVEVQVNGGAFQPANGAATWAYNLVAGEGSYTIQSRATDVAGNVETPGNGVTVIADATPPDVTVTSLLATPIVPTRNGETSGSGQWSVTLGGTAIDPASGGQPGSGVQPDSVEVLLVAQAGDDDAQGNGWQQATLNGNNWSIDYLFADALPDPTGTYAVYVRASDRMGNRTTLDGSTAGSLAAGVHAGNRTANSIALGALKLDGAAPLVTLSEADAVRAIITDTVTIGGAATDIGPAGVQQVEFSVVTLEQIAALPVDVSSDEAQTLLDATGRVWLPAGLAQPGAAATTWGAQIPAGLEGEYQIDLRGTDMLGNRRTSPNVWRGVIDTRAPRLVIEGAHTGAIYFDEAAGIQRYEFIYTCSTEDRYLVEQDFVCDGNDFQPPARFFVEDGSVQALFPDRTILSKLSNAYSRWEESLQPMSTVSACDAFGHCASQENQQPEAHSSQGFAGASEPGAPKAVVISPGNLRYVAGEAAGPGALPVTVVAEAGQGLKQVTLALDGVDVHTVAFAQSERVTRTLRTFSVTVAGVGEHTLTARATDWAGATQSALYPVTFKLDTQPPSVTLATVELTPADTWQLGSGILRFHGAASDDVGLAAVQIKVDDQPFANAAFGNGAWRTALPVVDPEGRALPVTVRAIDFAGQVTEVSRSIPANLAVADAPDTTITARPENPSNENGAIFEFTGSPGGDAEGAEVATFACKLDDAAYTPCASPWRYDNLSRGVHTFSVRAIDARGYADLSPAQFTWTVRTGSLDVAITGAPANPTNSRSATFTFTGSGARFECALDGGAFTPCASPQQYASLALGEHTFRVRASDETGEVSAPAQFTWRIVNTPPVAHDQTLTITGQASVAITLSATDADGDALVYTVVAPTAHGLLDGAPPDLIYTPDAGFTGEDRFTFAVNDGNGGVATGAVTIIVTNPGGQTDGVLLHLPLIANQN